MAESEMQKTRFKFPNFSEVKQGVPIYTKSHREPGANSNLCISIGGSQSGDDLIAAHKNSPFANQQRTTPVLNQHTIAHRPPDH